MFIHKRLSLGLSAALGVAIYLPLAVAAAEFSPHAGQRYPVRVYWGDTHLHSSLSTDAFGFGVRLGAEEAFRFAAREEVTSAAGLKARLDRPLDFVLLADHAESLGMMSRVLEGDPDIMKDDTARSWNSWLTSGEEGLAELRKLFFARDTRNATFEHLNALATPDIRQSIWHRMLEIAERHNRPGAFTTLLGFEWTQDRAYTSPIWYAP